MNILIAKCTSCNKLVCDTLQINLSSGVRFKEYSQLFELTFC